MGDHIEPTKLGGEFEFEAGRDDVLHYGCDKETYYVVSLPHSCDRWRVTYTQDKAQAIADVETFIAEAQAALEVLRSEP